MAKGDLVTDPKILAQLEGKKLVTDPELIARLEGGETDFDIGTMVSNIPSSAVQFGKDIVQPILHPVETAKGVANIGMGLGEKLIPGTQEHEKYVDQVGEFIKQRYGSVDAFQKTLMQDPVGVLSDASLAITGIGAGIKTAGTVGKVNALQKAGNVAQNIGMAAEPLNLAKNTAKYGIGKLTPKTLPADMYQSAAKFSTVMPPQDRAAITETALKYNIKPTNAGVGKLTMMIDDVGENIKTIISQADEAGVTIPKSVVFKNLNELRRSQGGFNLYGAKNLKKIDDIAKSFNEYLKKIGKDTVTPSELQAFKQNVYDEINWKKGGQSAELITNKIEKAIARAAKERLEQMNPKLGDLNKQQGEMLQLLDPLKKAAGRIENRNPLSMTTPMNVGVGSIIGDIPGAAAGLGASLTGAPSVLSSGAIGLYNAKNAGRGVLMNNSLPLTLGNQAALQLGRARREGLLNP